MHLKTVAVTVLFLASQRLYSHQAVFPPSGRVPDFYLQLNDRLTKLEQKVEEYHGSSKKLLPKHCKEVLEKSNNGSGPYYIQPDSSPEPFWVYCNMDTKGGGWTYLLNRFDGSQNFDLNWFDYKRGFGNLGGESWLGLDHLYYLTGNEINELLIELEDWDNKEVYALYDNFSIGSENEQYIMKILGTYSGTAGDSFRNQAGAKFTTRDRDNDFYEENCADYNTGGWWFNKCTWCHLTGKYLKGNVKSSDSAKIMYWLAFRGNTYSLKTARMMIRPKK